MSKEASKKKENNESRRVLYLETNILWSFPISFDHPLIQILLDVAEQWHFNIVIPEVSYLEWLQSKKEDIEKDVRKIKTGIVDLKEKYYCK